MAATAEDQDSIGFDHLADVADAVGSGDEVELATVSAEYKNPLDVVDATVTRWQGGGWRTARVVLEGGRGAEHDVVGVEGAPPVRDRTSRSTFRVLQLEPVGVELDEDSENDGPLAPDGATHKYTTDDAIDDLREEADENSPILEDGECRPWSSFDLNIPPDLTPEDLEAAVEGTDRLYGVCRELGLRPTDRGMIRVLLVNEGLYDRLKMPEGRQVEGGEA